MKYVYGPVPSWRLGASLGVDLLSQEEKICTFDCMYCQVGRTRAYVNERRIFVATEVVLREIRALPDVQLDYITLSGRGEPTLAKNLGDVIDGIKKIRPEPVAVLTNSSLLYRPDVRQDISKADFVSCKLDAADPETFFKVSKSDTTITFSQIVEGIRAFRKQYKGVCAVQIMFTKENRNNAAAMARIMDDVVPDEIQINTPLRAPATNALAPEEIDELKGFFLKHKVITVYDKSPSQVTPLSQEDVMKRRGAGK